MTALVSNKFDTAQRLNWSMPRGRFARLKVGCIIASLCVLSHLSMVTTAFAQTNMDTAAYTISQAKRQRLTTLLNTFEKTFQTNPAELETRQASNFALATLLLSHPVSVTQKYMQGVFAAQNLDETSPNYGVVRWLLGSERVNDVNAMEFNAMHYAAILALGENKFDPAFKAELIKSARGLVAAMSRRQFKTPAYTNIYLKNTLSLLTIGLAINDENAVSLGRSRLKDWIEFTRENGITEFNSPTYIGVSLDVLQTGYRYTRGEDREQIRQILDYFWTEAAANHMGDGLSGPFSRSYDFTSARARIDGYYANVGLPSSDPNFFGNPGSNIYVVLNDLPGGYMPPQSILQLANTATRVVEARWGSERWQTRINELTSAYAIGSVGGGAVGPQDRLFNVSFAKFNTRSLLVIPDSTDAPYGNAKVVQRDGHVKAMHVPVNLAAAQRDGTVLLTYDFRPGREKPTLTQFATNVLFPMAADMVMLNGKEILTTNRTNATTNATLAIRVGKACVVTRVLAAEGVVGAVEVFTDREGMGLGVSRMVLRHNPTAAKIRVAILVTTSVCANDDTLAQLANETMAAKATVQLGQERWHAEVKTASHHFRVERDAGKPGIVSRKIDGVELERPAPLSINGKAITLAQ
jgi:hypothetical protein